MKRKILLTGASSEIGSAIARKLVGPGDEAVLHCHRGRERCDALAQELAGACAVHPADLSDPASLEEICRLASGCDVLVNCAAVTGTGLLVRMPDDEIDRMIAANIRAPAALCRAALSGMLPRRGGVIVNISSVAASRGNPGQAVYAGTKGFLESLTRSLAAEYGPKGIRVNAVAPGAIDAGSLRDLLAESREELLKSTALRRLGTAEDVANVVAFLCSEEARFISGAVVAVDGGFARGV